MKYKDTFLKNYIFVSTTIFIVELLFRLISKFSLISYESFRILISCFIFGLIVTFLTNLIKKRTIRNIINLLFILIYAFYAFCQVGFINYLGVYISFHTSSQFGAVKEYIGEFISSFRLIFFVLFIPVIIALLLTIIYSKKSEYVKINLNKKYLSLIAILILLCSSYYLTLTLTFMQNKYQSKSNKRLFKSPDVPTVAVSQFGTTVFGLLDFKSFVFPYEEEEIEYVNKPKDNMKAITKRSVSPFLDDLVVSESDSKYQKLNNYFSFRNITDSNEYTGMFEGKNVVVILMESVNEAFINEEHFPNFYKLYSEGWHWVNNYSPRNSCATGNNEFSSMTSLYSIYNTCTTNIYKNNTYYESIFNLFNNKGYNTSSYHNFGEWYYSRKTYHKNMGSGKYYDSNALGIKTPTYYGEWTSDEELFEKSFDILLEDQSKPFMAYLITVSAHQPYTNSSTYGNMYKSDFQQLGYSKAISTYLSKLKVLDNGIGIMLEKLEENNILDDTVIVLFADHYPYGLKNDYLKEVIDHSLDEYESEKTPFVIYNSEMEPKEFTEYTSYMNIVPTIANLANLEYDPRLYLGSDLLSEEYQSRVVFADGSWKNEKAYYNASTGRIKYYDETFAYSDDEIKSINEQITTDISMSSSAIKNNYFKYLENKYNEFNNETTE